MKTITAFLCLMATASLAHAQASPAAKPVDPKDAPLVVTAVDPKAAPATPVDPKAATAAKKEIKKDVPLPKIPGTVIDRPNGTFLSLTVVSGNFVLSFYDKKHKLMGLDVTRASARWPNTRSASVQWNRTVLNGSGTALVGSKPVLPPFTFNVHLTLLKGDGDDAKVVEEYDVAFRG
jgi:hypothetical protein